MLTKLFYNQICYPCACQRGCGGCRCMGRDQKAPGTGLSIGPVTGHLRPRNRPRLGSENRPFLRSDNQPLLRSGNCPLLRSGNHSLRRSRNRPLLWPGNHSLRRSRNRPLLKPGNHSLHRSRKRPLLKPGNHSLCRSRNQPFCLAPSARERTFYTGFVTLTVFHVKQQDTETSASRSCTSVSCSTYRTGGSKTAQKYNQFLNNNRIITAAQSHNF